jgi:hypothetical protein
VAGGGVRRCQRVWRLDFDEWAFERCSRADDPRTAARYRRTHNPVDIAGAGKSCKPCNHRRPEHDTSGPRMRIQSAGP